MWLRQHRGGQPAGRGRAVGQARPLRGGGKGGLGLDDLAAADLEGHRRLAGRCRDRWNYTLRVHRLPWPEISHEFWLRSGLELHPSRTRRTGVREEIADAKRGVA